MKKQLKHYLYFSSKELIIFIVLVITVLCFVLYPILFSENQPKTEKQNNELPLPPLSNTKEKYSQESRKFKSYESNKVDYSNQETRIIKPFQFNPNTLDMSGFEKLGLSSKTAQTVINYRNKGGKFYKPDDFRKIWGLKKEDADVLVPYIIIESNKTQGSYSNTFSNRNETKILSPICINTATVNDFKALPAVGNLAYRIINFRDKLGGFISTQQVKETYGLTDSVFSAMQPYLMVSNMEIKKLSINEASEADLAQHPYISKTIARAIVIYRNQQGKFQSVEDLKNIVFIKLEIIEKIKPYLSL